jgi:hypothetical protein
VSVAEFRRETLAPDDERASRRPSAHYRFVRGAIVIADRLLVSLSAGRRSEGGIELDDARRPEADAC